MTELRIFSASPSDMAAEIHKVEAVARMLEPLAADLGITLKILNWRNVVPNMGRAEKVILDQLNPTEWDVFVGVLWHRFGTPPASVDPQTHERYLSGTEEEFKTAYRLWRHCRKPRIMIYRCLRAIRPDVLDADQFKRVNDFFSQFDAVTGHHPGLYQSFDTAESFEKLLLDNLQRLLLEYGRLNRGDVARHLVESFIPKRPDNLPRRTPFFGRDGKIETVLSALNPEDRGWGVIVDGIGGIGKTALALEAAYRVKERGLFDAFVFVSAKQSALTTGGIRSLTPVARTFEEFLTETARVLGQTALRDLVGAVSRSDVFDALRGTRTLLIYDNLETLSEQAREALIDLLRELPSGCKAIVTSRRRGGEGALWVRLDEINWEAAKSIIESEMRRDKPFASKLRHAGEARWRDLYEATKGSPLALVHLLRLLRNRPSLTIEDAPDLFRGNLTPEITEFVFQEAQAELSDDERIALFALSLFTLSASFDAWMHVASLPRGRLQMASDRLSAFALVDTVGEEQFTLHQLTRSFVSNELLADNRVENAIRNRFDKYFEDSTDQHRLQPTVMRFGGSVMEDADSLTRITQIVRSRRTFRPVVIVAGFRQATRLSAVDRKMLQTGHTETVISFLEERCRFYVDVAAGVLSNPSLSEFEARVVGAHQQMLDALSRVVKEGPSYETFESEVLLLSQVLSGSLFAAVLREQDVPSRYFDFGESIYLRQNLWDQETQKLIRAKLSALIEESEVPVLGDFGTYRSNDYSIAQLVSCAVAPREIQIWTDVAGILTADPNLVVEAVLIPRLSYEEADVLAHCGVKPLDRRIIGLAREQMIPIRICHSSDPDGRGTVVSSATESAPGSIKAIACKTGVTTVRVASARMLGSYGFMRAFFSVLERYRTTVSVATTSEDAVSLALDNTASLPKIVNELEELGSVEIETDRAIICIVGEGLFGSPGMAARVFSTISDISGSIISQGASRISMSFVVEESRAREAILRLHKALFERSGTSKHAEKC